MVSMFSGRSRPCVYDQDKDSLLNLVRAYRLATGVDRYPTTWRTCLFLTSRVWEPERDSCVWYASSGQMAALAILWRRKPDSPYLLLERFINPTTASNELEAEILTWSCRRAAAVARQQACSLTLYAYELPPELHLANSLEAYGFTFQPPNPTDYTIYFRRTLHGALPEPALPEGYSKHPVRDLAELHTLHSQSSFAAVSLAHQQELFASDEYCNLVAVAPDGSLAGYCECSFDQVEWQSNGIRIGWIDYLETLADHQGKGLGQVLLWAGLQQLLTWGAEQAMLVTVNSNSPAVHLYEKVGFERDAGIEPASYARRFESSLD